MRFSGVKKQNLPSPTMLPKEFRQYANQMNHAFDLLEKDLNFRAQEYYWDDLRFPASNTKRLGLSDPDWVKFKDDGAGSVGVYELAFSNTVDEEVFFSVQMPHAWKEGSFIYPHVHWAPSTAAAGGVTWALEYTWANINGEYGNTSTITFDDSTNSTSHQHLIAGNDNGIDGDGKTISSMLICRLYRDVSDANDTYAADAFFLEFDIHYQIDWYGSIKEREKWT